MAKEVAPAFGPSTVEHFLYDAGSGAIDGDQQIAWQFQSGGTVTNRYLHGPAVDQILADEQVGGSTAQVLYPLADQLGSVRDLADYDEQLGITQIAQHLVYDAFGRIQMAIPSTPSHLFGYTGREYDTESGLSYYRARYYDAALGQFLNEDPLGFDARDANLRRYVGNGPLDATDPSGMEELLQRSTIDCHQPSASSVGTHFDLSLLSDRQYEPNTTPAAPDPPAYPNTLSGKHLQMVELMMDGVVGNPDAIRREVQRQYAVSQNTPIRALIGSADDFVNGRTESVTHGELKQYVESVPDAAKGYFIDGPTQVTQETFELVDDVLTRGPTAMSRDLGTTVGTLWSSPEARDQAFTTFERSFQECLDNPEKGGAASFKLAFSVLGGEEVAARSMVEWTKRAGSAGRLLGHLDDVNLGDASRLGTMTETVSAPNRSELTFVSENLGAPRNAAQQAARDFESGTIGAFTDVATRQRSVPALRFNNPNANGANVVKFDGFSQLDDGVIELIDSKTRIVPFATRQGPFISPSVRDGLMRKSMAIDDNPGFRAVLEFPTAEARREAQQVLRQLGITNISTRVRQ
jgi:RHS repeat-associated protein